MNGNDYTGPVVGYTNDEIAWLIGKAVLNLLDKEEMQIIWKPKDERST